MTSDPRVTIVVATRDRHDVLRDSLARHSVPAIVVDNASREPIPDAIRLERNLGGAGRNVGVEAASTPYVALTDDDAWWAHGALERAVAVLDAHPRLALVQARVLVGPDERLDPTCAEMARSPLRGEPDQPGHAILGFVACAVVVRRDAFLSVGGFSERLHVGGEEALLAGDLVAAGWQLSYVPSVVAHHCPPETSRDRPERREVVLRNALWMHWLRRPARIAAVRTAATLAGAPREPATVRAAARALAGVPWVLRERRVSPARVEAMRRLLDEAA
ncbi:glycosyltransferase [Solirubrobacter sp. CPCC 204708]|uniref:Glycosyltransferase n=1 Tax=Solirubrobacter deserti TaxID=2282478 RepID=A0ABT4REK5_9ACTN|nr:glycosyltransferase [Solirubrobacter deserti]MBE2315998.1 glycosyltransferase [Solirubrobacter deserti]MDA0136750.1 glycosyltransferase [Solirubrobacter deserti]